MPPPLKVLIAEDSPEDAELLLHELRRAGFEPDWQRVDTEAGFLDRLHAGLDLVLSDYQMPRFTGLQALELLKQRGLDVPFILVSATIGEDTAVQAMKHGATDYLIKDRLARLGPSVAHALEARRLRAERRRADQQIALQSTALATIANAVVITDAKGTIQWVNAAFTTLTGYSASEAVGRTPRLLKSGKQDRGFYKNLWARILGGESWQGSFINRRKDGSLYVDEHTITPVAAPDGGITHFVAILNDVTARREAEEAQRTSEARYRFALDNMMEAVQIVGFDWRYLYLNAAAAIQNRRPNAELLDRKMTDLWPGIQTTAVFALLRRCMNERLALHREIEFAFPDGSTGWFDVHTQPVPEGIFVLSIDITERKRATEALRAMHAQLNHLVARSPTVIYSLELNDGRPQPYFVSENILTLSGFTPAEFLDPAWWDDHVLPADRGVAADSLRLALQQETSRVEYRFTHKNGSVVWIEDRKRALPATGDRAAEVVGGWTDITARKQAEAATREIEERFRQVVENIHESFWMTDVAQSQMLYVSPAYEVIWGRTCASLYAAPQSWLESVDPLDREQVAHAAKTKRASGDYDETYRINHPDGTLRWVRDRAFPVRDPAGRVIRLVGTSEDVTARKQLEEQFLRAQRLESVGMLAAGIAHDLNNVLAPIGMVSTLLRRNTTESADLRLLDTLETCAGRGAGLVKQILGFVHGLGGELREVQVKHLLRDIVGVITETFPKSITLVEEVPDDLWPVKANPTQIHQVLLNLCVNARDAMPDGGTLRLRAGNCTLDAAAAAAITGARPGPWLLLHVEDTGTGIAPGVLARVWEPFFTTKPANQGTGLGLSTVRGIVETCHGFVTLHTEVGRGTTFRIYLPAVVAAIATPALTAVPHAGHGHGELILLVDDEAPIRDAASAILTNAGYRVVLAADGAEAITLFASRAAEVSLVITDLDMPRLDGAGVAHAVHLFKPELKILAMSGLNRRSLDKKKSESFSCFITKPFTAHTLLSNVQNLLRGQSTLSPAIPPWPESWSSTTTKPSSRSSSN